MIDPDNVPPVDAGELLARFLMQKSHFRPGDGTVKPDAFVPHPYEELSVNRHRDASVDEIWAVGQSLAAAVGRSLKGRADVLATAFLRQELSVQAAPIDGNPNHANVLNWPKDKPAQKAMAQEIAKQATFAPTV